MVRARGRAEILEDRLEETVRMNRRLEREVAEAVGLGVRGWDVDACYDRGIQVYRFFWWLKRFSE